MKVAPEHTSDETLHIMRKPSFRFFHAFKKRYDRLNKKHRLAQPLIPYFISSHPGSKEEDMAHLACETKDMGFRLEQVQGFTPTPMTVATIIYYTGLHPYTLKPIYTAKSKRERMAQHLFFFWYKPENRRKIRDKLGNWKRWDMVDKLLGNIESENKSSASKSSGKRKKGKKRRR